jgi:hypothetical protein
MASNPCNYIKLGGRIGPSFVRDIPARDAVYAVNSLLPSRARVWATTLRDPMTIPMTIDGYTLDPYQIDTVAKLRPGGGVLTLGCGLGKTITALAAALALTPPSKIAGNTFDRIYIVCPLNALGTWKPFIPWLKQRFAEVVLISQDSLHKIQAIGATDSSCIIFDEVHGMGAWSAQRTKLAHYVRWQFTVGLCLTGTLLHAGPEKVLSIMDLAIPGAALFGNKYEFGRHFGCLVRKTLGNRSVHSVEKVPAHRLEEFQRYLDRLVVCKNKNSPDVRASVIIPDQDVGMVEIGDTSLSLTLEAVAAAREILAEDPNGVPSMSAVMHRLSHVGTEAKLDWLLEQMHGDDQQVVVFATYHDTLDQIQARLEHEQILFVRVDGGVTGPARDKKIKAFQDGAARVFLAQSDAASVSMNLQCAKLSVMFDSTWKATVYEQAMARTCRRGQPHRCHHFNLLGNHFQKMVFKRLESACDFDAQVAEYQDIKQGLTLCSSP